MESEIKQLSDHFGLLVVLVVGLWWIFSRVKTTYDMFRQFVGNELEERLPTLLKRELQNGLGDLVELRMRKALEEHTREEQNRFERAIAELKQMIRGGH